MDLIQSIVNSTDVSEEIKNLVLQSQEMGYLSLHIDISRLRRSFLSFSELIEKAYTHPVQPLSSECQRELLNQVDLFAADTQRRQLDLEIHHLRYRRIVAAYAHSLGLQTESIVNREYGHHPDSDLILHERCGRCVPVAFTDDICQACGLSFETDYTYVRGKNCLRIRK